MSKVCVRSNASILFNQLSLTWYTWYNISDWIVAITPIMFNFMSNLYKDEDSKEEEYKHNVNVSCGSKGLHILLYS